MSILAVALAGDPDLDPAVARALAMTTTDRAARWALRAHPATLGDALGTRDREPSEAGDPSADEDAVTLADTLRTAWATAQTRTRTVALTATRTLALACAWHPDIDPAAVTELTARRDAGDIDPALHAMIVLPFLDRTSPAHRDAVSTLLATPAPPGPTWDDLDAILSTLDDPTTQARLVTHACYHPDHLATFATTAADRDTRARLRHLARQSADSGVPALSIVIDDARAAAVRAPQYGWATAVRSTFDPDLAREAIQASHLRAVSAITGTVELWGEACLRHAHAATHTDRHLPVQPGPYTRTDLDRDLVDLEDDADVALTRALDIEPLDPDLVAATWRRVHSAVPHHGTRALEISALLRLALFPDLDPVVRRDAARHLRDHRQAHHYAPARDLLPVTDALAAGTSPLDAIHLVPARALTTRTDTSLDTVLAAALRPWLRTQYDRLRDPGLLACAERLAPTFTGPLHQLLDTATTITSAPSSAQP